MFQKQYYCKHWLGVAVRKTLITVCDKSTTILVTPSRGRPFDYKTEEHSRRLGGRPAKVAPALVIESQSSAASGAAKRGRGRPKKRALTPTPDLEDIPEPPKKKRGRTCTRPLTPPTLTTTDNHPKRKRGRPKKIN